MNHSPELNTIRKFIRNVLANIHPKTHTFLKHKVGNDWVEISYKQALTRIDAISAWFLSIGIKKGDRLGLIIENGPDYVYYDQALQQIGAVNTSIYPTLTETEIAYILNDSGIKTILTGNPFLFRKVIKVANSCPALISVIPAFEDHEKYTEKVKLNAGVISFKDVIARGMEIVDE